MLLFLFDFDSTLVPLETLDYAAAEALAGQSDREGRLAEIAALTEAGMSGAMDYSESLSRRVALAGLTREICERLAADIANRIPPEIEALFSALRAGGAEIAIVSGGLRPLLAQAAKRLGVSDDALYCNDPIWEDKSVVGVDAAVPLSRNGGKREIAARLKARAPDRRVVMVGDGATDLEARAPGAADWMIGYGGVKARDVMRRGADAFAADLPALARLCRAELSR